jgi:hypothetical protein
MKLYHFMRLGECMAEPQYKATLGDRVFDMGFTGGLVAGISSIAAGITKRFTNTEGSKVAEFFKTQVANRLPEKLGTFASSKPIVATAAVTGALGALYSLFTYSKKHDVEGADIMIKALQEERAKLASSAEPSPSPDAGEAAQPKPSHADKVLSSRAEASQRVSAL